MECAYVYVLYVQCVLHYTHYYERINVPPQARMICFFLFFESRKEKLICKESNQIKRDLVRASNVYHVIMLGGLSLKVTVKC